jgi:hypothetical protein
MLSAIYTELQWKLESLIRVSLGEMSPHNALIAINFRIDGEPEVGNCCSALLRFAREAMPSNRLR